MESQHMTQQVFADFLGINPATLSGIFNDRTKPTINVVEAVKKKFPDISLDWLMFGSGSMFKQTASPIITESPTPAAPIQSPQPRSQEPVLDFGDAANFPPPSHISQPTASHYNGVRNTHQEIVREEVKYIDKPTRRVTEIRVYYDDQTWESFVPTKK